ncbi:hypothetical protein [Actinocrispum sp. NPDC049592]|uniref:hypothetical protein n=1 Tax=Actinocrispum sp. NPDC049592 TaxID=3154835 RepID=UPI0034221C6E
MVDRRLFDIARWSLMVAVWLLPVLYVFGLMRLLHLENAYHTCTQARFGVPDDRGLPVFGRLDSDVLPPRSVCTWVDGYTLDRVPWFVTPTMFVCLVVAAAASPVVISARRRGVMAGTARRPW